MRTLLPLCMLTLLSDLSGCTSCGSGPPPLCTVKAVADRGVLEQAATIRGRDGGYPGLFAGKSIWLYGDTILAEPNAIGSNWLNNSWSYSADVDAADGITGFVERLDAVGAPTEFFPQTEAEQAFNDAHRGEECQQGPCGARWALWPGAFVVDAANDRALVFYHKIYAEPGKWNFHGVGSSIAIWRDFESAPERPVIQAGSEHPTLLFSGDDPAFGDAALIADGMLYAYACELDWMDKPCILGRVPLDSVLDRSAWRFFARHDEWVPEVDRARTLFMGNDIISVAANRHFNCYLAVYSQPMDHKVMLRTAPRPEGPWSAAIEAFEAQQPDDDSGWIYDGLPHPELEDDNGRIQYVTYSRATGFLQSEMRLVELVLE